MNVIEFKHIWKTYNLKRGRSIKSLLTDIFTERKISQQPFYALQDVSFAVERGSLVGIIGQNGAGKTTILKLLSGITQPTQGHLRIEGRIGALINLGAGFHPELTGRENIYLYGSIMGLKRQEIAKHFDEIVDFAGLQEFIDVPVKRYSSGMFVRLGFSTAIHIEPDILLVDEVLAVGDLQFQQKALDKIRKFIATGKGIVFVSHNLPMVQSLCGRVIWLEQGKLREEGEPRTVISHYMSEMNQQALNQKNQTSDAMLTREGTGDIRILEAELRNGQDDAIDVFDTGETLKIRFQYQAYAPIHHPEFRVSIHATEYMMPLFGAVSAVTGRQADTISGKGVVECTFSELPLTRSSTYVVSLHVYSNDGLIAYDRWDHACEFTIRRSLPATQDHQLLGQEAFVAVPFTFHYER